MERDAPEQSRCVLQPPLPDEPAGGRRAARPLHRGPRDPRPGLVLGLRAQGKRGLAQGAQVPCRNNQEWLGVALLSRCFLHTERGKSSLSLLSITGLNPEPQQSPDWSEAALDASRGVTDSESAPSYALGSFRSLPHTSCKLAAFWWVKDPGAGTFLSHHCEHGAGPASEPLTWRACEATTGVRSPTLKSFIALCFALAFCWSLATQQDAVRASRGEKRIILHTEVLRAGSESPRCITAAVRSSGRTPSCREAGR